MELVASLPPDLAAFADPTARAAAPPLRPTDQDDAAKAAAAPFDLLLAMLMTPLPSGETLPAGGNALPADAVGAAADATAPTTPSAKPVTGSLFSALTGAELLGRLKLAVAPAAAPVAADPSSALPAQSTDAAAASELPLADLDLPSTPDAAATKPTAAAPTAPAPTADVAPRPDVAAALEAALPQTGARDSTPKSRTGQARAIDQAAATPLAATSAADLRAAQASSADAPAPVAEIVDNAARPVRHDAAFEAFALPVATPSADAAGPPTNATPVLAPGPSHVSSAAAPTADASALTGQGAAIDTRADNWHEALASRVQVLVDQHIGEAHIKLNPPELGAVDIKISLVDDKTFVQLTAGSSAARDELTQSLPRLRELLSAGGLSLGGTSVHGGSGGQAGQDASPRAAVPAGYSPFGVAADNVIEPVRAAARAAGRIDLFA